MLRLTSPQITGRVTHLIDMTPMIDMVFLLLIFFLLTSIFAGQQVLDLVLPEAGHARDPIIVNEMHITIQKEGRVFVDKREVAIAELESTLRGHSLENQHKTVFLSADKETPFHIFVKVLDTLQGMGLPDLNIVTQREDSQ